MKSEFSLQITQYKQQIVVLKEQLQNKSQLVLNLNKQLQASQQEAVSWKQKYQTESQSLNLQIQQLKIQLSVAQNESKEWQQKYQETEKQRLLDLEELRLEFERYKEASDARNLGQQFNSERELLKSEIDQLKRQVNQLQHSNQQYLNDNNHLQQVNQQKTSEFDVLQTKFLNLTNSHQQDMHVLQQQIAFFKKQNLDIQELTVKFGAEKTQLENRIQQLEVFLENINIEKKRLYDLLNSRKQENEETLFSADELKRQNMRLSKLNQELEADNLYKTETLNLLQQESSAMANQKSNLKAEVDSLNMTLSTNQMQLVQKMRELDTVKTNMEDRTHKMEEALYTRLSQHRSLIIDQ